MHQCPLSSLTGVLTMTALNGPVVFNLATQNHLPYFSTATPRQALLNAYALSRHDGNSWDYENRYGSLIEETARFLFLGDFCVAKAEANHGA
jgi:hypothetical protein